MAGNGWLSYPDPVPGESSRPVTRWPVSQIVGQSIIQIVGPGIFSTSCACTKERELDEKASPCTHSAIRPFVRFESMDTTS